MISANQQLLDNAIGHSIDLTRYSNSVVRDILAILNEADKELVAKIQARQIDNWTTKRLNAVLVDVRRIVAKAYNVTSSQMIQMMIEFAEKEAVGVASNLTKSLPQFKITPSADKYSRFLKLTDADGREVGRMQLTEKFKRYLYVNYTFVDEDYRGLKLGLSLYDAAQKYAWEADYDGIISNPDARNSSSNRFWNTADRLELGSSGDEYDFLPAIKETPKPNVTKLVWGVTSPTAEQLAAIVSTEPILVGEGQVALLEEIFQGLAANKEKTIRQAIRLGMVEGETVDQMVRRLIGTKAARFTDGIIEKDRRGAEAMVRTIVNSTSNKAADATYKANGDIIKGLAWTSTLDSRTSPICQARDGKVFPVDSGPRPPAHVNCRSFMVPVLKSWKELGVPLDEMDEGMRSSMDGLVPESTTYGTWLKGKDKSFQEKVLGVERARLFRSGEYDIKDFVNAKGEYKKLSDL